MKTDSHPYREDPTKLLREAHELSNTAHERLNVVQSRFDEFDKRIKSLENNIKAQHGFFRTSWNGFWEYVRKVFDFILSTEFFFFCGVVTVVLAVIFAIYDSIKSSDNDARLACEHAHMSLLANGTGTIICLREDGAVLTISNGHTPTLALPASIEQVSE